MGSCYLYSKFLLNTSLHIYNIHTEQDAEHQNLSQDVSIKSSKSGTVAFFILGIFFIQIRAFGFLESTQSPLGENQKTVTNSTGTISMCQTSYNVAGEKGQFHFTVVAFEPCLPDTDWSFSSSTNSTFVSRLFSYCVIITFQFHFQKMTSSIFYFHILVIEVQSFMSQHLSFKNDFKAVCQNHYIHY